MTKYSIFILTTAWLLGACANTQKLSAVNTEKMDTQKLYTDSVIASLQEKNDLVLASVVETFAWGKSATYQIITKNGDEWMGYFYYVNLMENVRVNGAHPFNINPVLLPKEACEEVYAAFQANAINKIHGDNGKDFCGNAKATNCNINDGASYRLLWLTKSTLADPSFYEPEYYENCCPGNTDRQKFIAAMKKIQDVFTQYGHGR